MDTVLDGEHDPDAPLVRAVRPDGADWIEVATSFSHLVPDCEGAALAHGWGVAAHDYDVQAYQRITV